MSMSPFSFRPPPPTLDGAEGTDTVQMVQKVLTKGQIYRASTCDVQITGKWQPRAQEGE